MKRVCIVIPTHNRKGLLTDLLRQIQDMEAGTWDLKLIVVVDGSTDGTIEMLKEQFPHVYIVPGTGNWWYTRSMNEGFKFANTLKPDYLLALNDDVRLTDMYFQNLEKASNELGQKAIIGSVSLTEASPPRVIFSGIRKLIRWRMKLVRYQPMLVSYDKNAFSGTRESIVLPGRGMLIPHIALMDTNYFDDRFAQYHSDFDFCLRAQKLGYRSYISYETILYSYMSETAAGSSFMRSSFSRFVKDIFNRYSRTYYLDNIRYIYRHGNKLLLPLSLPIGLLSSFKAFLFNDKLN